MITLLTGFATLLFTGQPAELTQFKAIAYEFNSTLSGESIYDSKKCPTDLSAIAYAFAMKETGNGKGLSKQKWKNNLFGLRYGRGKPYRPMFNSYDVMSYTPNGYNIYKKREDSIYDFMQMFYNQGCKLSVKYVGRYKNGSKGGMGGAQEYYNQIQRHIKYYKSLKFKVKIIK